MGGGVQHDIAVQPDGLLKVGHQPELGEGPALLDLAPLQLLY